MPTPPPNAAPVPPAVGAVPAAVRSPSGTTAAGGGWRAVLIGLVGSWVVRALAATLRWRTENLAAVQQREGDEPFIVVFWHNRLLLVPVVWQRFLRIGKGSGGVALTSTSRDGEIIAQILSRFGIGPVRGSATQRGSTAIRELVRCLRRGHDVGITPDGSRGPCYEIKPGFLLLAQLSGRRILPISFEYANAWRTKSWDRFFIPRPFSAVTFVVGDPFSVRRTDTPKEFEAERLRCEQAIFATVRER